VNFTHGCGWILRVYDSCRLSVWENGRDDCWFDESCFMRMAMSSMSQIRSGSLDAKKFCPELDAGARAWSAWRLCWFLPRFLYLRETQGSISSVRNEGNPRRVQSPSSCLVALLHSPYLLRMRVAEERYPYRRTCIKR
jgi:hypothetical protein